MPSLGRFGVERLFLYGLGAPRGRIDDGIKLLLAPTLASLGGAGVARLAVAVAPPHLLGPEPSNVPAELLVRWLEAVGTSGVPFTEITLLEAGDELTSAAPRLRAAALGSGLEFQS